ncbi:hypothetical protein HUT19_37630 [Streptomyces sp. NA02950]|uniref:hypothetical protein n=1 Tax=Streptomyces sp. NA02950 TaxID=2742137 RepID=UPI00158FAEF8|nr:hypothetical protein [Streptomyces sp. NA02950]QKV96716.1 hypothetical protein HUT19_37630 [Streptomyces sp. NA02950]
MNTTTNAPAAPVSALVPVAALWVAVAAFAARVAGCSACAALRPGSYCLSHVCLDCGGGAVAPAGSVLPC